MNLEEYVDSFVLNSESPSQMEEIAGKIDGQNLKNMLYKLRAKDQKNVSYTQLFVTSYINTIKTKTTHRQHYKTCQIVQNSEDCVCKIISTEKEDKTNSTEGHNSLSVEEEEEKTAIANLFVILNMNKKNALLIEPVLTKLLLLATQRNDLQNINNIASYLSTLEPFSELYVVIADMLHIYHSLDYCYEAYKMLSLYSRLPLSNSTVNTFRTFIMRKYFLDGNNYRGYLNSIEILQGRDVKISPPKEIAEFVKYQKIITDYDKIINYKPRNSKYEINMTYKVIDKISDKEKEHWNWYVQELSGTASKVQEEKGSVEELVEKVAFLRRNRLKYEISGGNLKILAGNTKKTFIEMIEELGETKPVEVSTARQDLQHTAYKVQEKEGTVAEKVSTEGAKRRAKEKVKILFERKEYLLRSSIKLLAADSNRIEASFSLGEALSVVNSRFKQAKERQLEQLRTIVSNYPTVCSVLKEVEEFIHIESKLKEEKETAHITQTTEKEEAPDNTFSTQPYNTLSDSRPRASEIPAISEYKPNFNKKAPITSADKAQEQSSGIYVPSSFTKAPYSSTGSASGFKPNFIKKSATNSVSSFDSTNNTADKKFYSLDGEEKDSRNEKKKTTAEIASNLKWGKK